MEVLDIATGTGNVAIKAARVGARVTGLDLTPELFERGRERAARGGRRDRVGRGRRRGRSRSRTRASTACSRPSGSSSRPRHEVAAREAVRVARPGATIGLINWTPQGLLGQVLKTVGSRLPKPPEYASPPPLWGDEDHVRELFAGAGAEFEFERAVNPFVGLRRRRGLGRVHGGQLRAAAESARAAHRRGHLEELREELVELTASFDRGGTTGIWLEAEYLLALARLPTG